MRTLLLLATLCGCSPAIAHDFWLQPEKFTVAPQEPLSTTLMVGHGPARQRSPIPIERITKFVAIGPTAELDQQATLHPGQADDATLALATPGTYVLALETNYTTTTLPAIRYNDYLAAEGLQAVIDWRLANDASGQPGSELYARRAKAIVVVGEPGATGSQSVTQPLGMSLEIVPAADPSTLHAGDSLAVAVRYDGEPLAGALVKLTDLSADERPLASTRTDEAGGASFTVPYAGTWLLNVIWSVPAPDNPAADFLTTFSSLSFAID